MFLFSCILLLTRNRFFTQIHTHTNSHTHTVTVCLTAISCDFKIVIKFYVHIHTHIHFKSTFLPLYFSFVLPTTAFSFSLLVKYIILCASPSSVCPLLYFTHQPFHNNSNICAVWDKIHNHFCNTVLRNLWVKISNWKKKKHERTEWKWRERKWHQHHQQQQKTDLKLSPYKNHWNGNNCTYRLNYYIEFSKCTLYLFTHTHSVCLSVCLVDCYFVYVWV